MHETREAARAALADDGIDAAQTEALFARCPTKASCAAAPTSSRGRRTALLASDGDEPCRARGRCARTTGALEVFVHSPDRDGLFAAIVATLDRLGLAIQQARLLDGRAGDVFDTFEVLPAEGQRRVGAGEVERRITAALAHADLDAVRPARRAQPRHLRHFRIAPQVAFDTTADGAAAPLLSLVCDRSPRACSPTSPACCARSACACTMRASPPSASAPRTSSRSPTSATAARSARQQQALRDALLACLEGDPRR